MISPHSVIRSVQRNDNPAEQLDYILN